MNRFLITIVIVIVVLSTPWSRRLFSVSILKSTGTVVRNEAPRG